MRSARPAGSLRADLALLRRRRFALLFAGRTISMFGNGFAPVAVAFGVLALPGATPATLSTVLAAHAVPQIGLILLGGVIADRLPRHRVLVAAETTSGVAFAALAVMLLTGWAPVVLLAGCAFVAGSASSLLLPALTRVVPDVVPRADLQPANALLRLGSNGANIGGVALAGVAVAILGPGVALAVDAASYLLAAGLLAGLRPAHQHRTPTGAERPRQVRRVVTDARDGLREFVSRQWLWAMVVSAAFLNAGTSAAFAVLGPVLADQRLGGPVPWSVILAAYTVGMLTSVVAALRMRPVRPLRTGALVTPLLAAPLIAMGAGVPLALVAVAAFAAGAALNLFSVLWETTLQQQVPAGVLARVTACNYLVALSLKPLAIFLAGHAADRLGAAPAVLVLSVVLLVAGTVVLVSPQVRHLTTDATGDSRESSTADAAGVAGAPATPGQEPTDHHLRPSHPPREPT